MSRGAGRPGPRGHDRSGKDRRRGTAAEQRRRGTGGQSGGQSGRSGARGTRTADTRQQSGRPAPTTLVELTFLAGLRDVLHDEVVTTLAPRRAPVDVAGRDDALAVRLDGPLADVQRLRTAVAAYVVLHFDVPRPRSLTSGDHLARIVDAVYASLRVAGSSSFRFEAAGADSAVFQRLAALVHEATGLIHDPQDGELVLRVRRGAPAGSTAHGGRATTVPDPGWDVLVRVGPRPLSARTWRVADYPGALNATIAAAIVRMAGVRDDDRVLNLMCGSGTLLVERLLVGPAAAAVGVDDSPAALDAARANLAAARTRATLVQADALLPLPAEIVPSARDRDLEVPISTGSHDLARPGGFDVVLVDPPWGGLHGAHAQAAEVHAGVLRAARAAAAPGARCVVVTHEVKVMERCLREAADLWTLRQTLRVYAKGHHPRVYVLDAA